ncbi:hypothetical protein [Nocardia sp. NPDC050175]|uniref:hypothetical protein n=1 Tax=Nocardia sp. NPDC050175 TaxID=3364317 RepID=UPI0037885AF9
MGANGKLPQRLVSVDVGRVKHPTLVYTAPPDVIRKFLVALKKSQPTYTVEVEPVDAPDKNVPPSPYWQLRAWEN